MKKYSFSLISGLVFSLLVSCSPAPSKKPVDRLEITKVFSLPGEVLGIDNDLVTLRVEKPTLYKADAKLALQLAQGIIDNSYFLEGKETNVNQARVKILRVMGNDVLIKILAKPPIFQPRDKVKIFLEKKIIAIRDFEVIMGRNKEVAQYVQEDLTTALVNSGQFNVVERLKLKSVLEELELSQTGLIDPDNAKRVGKLLGADFILTGTLAAAGGEEWNANIRLVNTEAGLITAAFNRQGPIEVKPESFKEIKNIDGSFESDTSEMAGWLMGTRFDREIGKGGNQKVYIDKKQGARGTHRSLAVDFKLGTKRIPPFQRVEIQAGIRNQLKRDLSSYSGIRFFIKASKNLTITFVVNDAQKGSYREESWYRNISATHEWREVTVSFNSLTLRKGKAMMLGTDQVLDLRNVERLNWVVRETKGGHGGEGTIWIDEVTFY